jgi:hypothetical protein
VECLSQKKTFLNNPLSEDGTWTIKVAKHHQFCYITLLLHDILLKIQSDFEGQAAQQKAGK